RPPAVGKLFLVATRKAARLPDQARRRSSWRAIRSANSRGGVRKPRSGSESQISSFAPSARGSTVQRVAQVSSVIESDGCRGTARSRSRAPQYLMNAMLAGAWMVVLLIDWPPGAGRRRRTAPDGPEAGQGTEIDHEDRAPDRARDRSLSRDDRPGGRRRRS